jgi:inorganic pyrophosphatase
MAMYWETLRRLVAENEIVIDRNKGSRHPRYPEMVYPLDYGYLAGTTTVDGGGIDIFVGSLAGEAIQGILTTVDLKKKDAEIKILYKCSAAEIKLALDLLNSRYMSALFIPNPDPDGAERSA